MIKFEIPQRGRGRASKKQILPALSDIVVPDYNIRENENVIIREQLKTKEKPAKEILIKQPSEQSTKSTKRKRISRTNRKGYLKQYADDVVQTKHEREEKTSLSGLSKNNFEYLPVRDLDTTIEKELDDEDYVNIRFTY